MARQEENKILSIALDILDTAKVLWWHFFDWLAEVSWFNLGLVLLVFFLGAALLKFPLLGFWLTIASIAIKSVAGGKRRAELMASKATMRADVEALERRLLEAQMVALQAQIEPHFLFNTLALIGQLIETDPAEASKIHAALIQYLRAAMPQMREGTGSRLGQQVELSRAYLQIMQARMRERLTVSITLPSELSYASFPSMMLQTLVENAIKHGIEPSTQGGHIAIKAYCDGGELIVEVADNGRGFDMRAGDGVGLSNIRERLTILYGAQASLTIEAPGEGGSRVSIHVPYPGKSSQGNQANK
ncbi:MAG: histidine kinase [Burkholderiaceae bacterium]|nr:histidine kinase [Burkholderiaceae bacterium]